MAREKFVVRLLDQAGALLAWAEVWASPKPQDRAGSCPFWPTGPTAFVIERAGLASQISVHWCDLDVARLTQPIGATEVQVGQVFTYAWLEPIWLVPGMRDVPLPAVTVGSMAIGVPVGGLGVVSQ